MIRKLATLVIVSLSLFLGCAVSRALEEVTSANGGDRLKKFHERFEKSDLNSDGVLTVDEMHDFLDARIKDGARSGKTKKKVRPGGGLGNLKSRIYLSVFLQESPNTDINKDGILTKEELLEYVLSQRKVITATGEVIPAPKVASAQRALRVSRPKPGG